MLPNSPFLVIAQSGRALAASAAVANIETHVIERFPSQDTLAYASSTHVVGGTDSGFDKELLRQALDNFKKQALAGVVVGSGFEHCPELLDLIDDRFKMYGNNTDIVRACKDPLQFFPLLERLGISFPETQMNRKDGFDGGLIKQAGGTGGTHIHPYHACIPISEAHYYQKIISGRSLSVVFLANGVEAQVLGISETWVRSKQDGDYRYAGAITGPRIGHLYDKTLREIIRMLVQHLRLVGLCGLDVIVDSNDRVNVLEVNPRPTATFELFEHEPSLFYAHTQACLGKFIVFLETDSDYRGHEVLYADTEFRVAKFRWPDWVADRPIFGNRIATGEPICTIRASATSPDGVRELLGQRKASSLKQLGLTKIAA